MAEHYFTYAAFYVKQKDAWYIKVVEGEDGLHKLFVTGTTLYTDSDGVHSKMEFQAWCDEHGVAYDLPTAGKHIFDAGPLNDAQAFLFKLRWL